MNSYKNFWMWMLPFLLLFNGCGGGGGGGINTTDVQTWQFSGQVLDGNGVAVAGARVQIESSFGLTDESGKFRISLSKSPSQTSVLNIAHPDFVVYAKYYSTAGEGLENKYILTSYSVKEKFPSSLGIQLAAGSARVVIPANALISGNGDPYTGQVTIRAHYGNHDTTAGSDSFQQPYRGVEGEVEKMLISAGAINVEMRGSDGSLLQIAQNSRATLKFPPSNTTGSAAEIPMWYYDTSRSIWVREGVASRQSDGSYVGSVSHFSPWNIDYPVALNTVVKGCVVNTSNEPVPYTMVRLVGPGFMTVGLADQEGKFESYVPAGIELQLSSYFESQAPLFVAPLATGVAQQLKNCLVLKQSSAAKPIPLGPALLASPVASTAIDPSATSSAGGSEAIACAYDDLARTLQADGRALKITQSTEGSFSDLDAPYDTAIVRYEGIKNFQGALRESVSDKRYIGATEMARLNSFFSVDGGRYYKYGYEFSGEVGSGIVTYTPTIAVMRIRSQVMQESVIQYRQTLRYENTSWPTVVTDYTDRDLFEGYEVVRIGDKAYDTCRISESSTWLTTLNSSQTSRSRAWVVAKGEFKGLTLLEESLNEAGAVKGRSRVTAIQWIQP